MQRERARQILADNLCIDVVVCKDNSNIKHDLGADSLSLLSFGVELAEELEIEDSEINFEIYKSKTVGEILDYVAAKNS